MTNVAPASRLNSEMKCPALHSRRNPDYVRTTAAGERTEEGHKQAASGCPFASTKKDSAAGDRTEEGHNQAAAECPFPSKKREDLGTENPDSPKCPFGYDSVSFKIGPLSCVICKALLYDTSRCVPCHHIFCRACISRFKDCVVCGADIDGITSYPELQGVVDRYIEGHARIKRPSLQSDENNTTKDDVFANVDPYEDMSLDRGSFLIQHAMRAFQAQNFESAKSRLQLCVEDTRDVLSRNGSDAAISSQLGAVLGMLGDCCRSMGDSEGSISNYEESVELLSNLPSKSDEVVHALSVSLNKIGDLKYYANDLKSAREFYSRALHLRQQSTVLITLSSQVLDVAVSLAKVADVNRALGYNEQAIQGFQEALKTLEGCSSDMKGNSQLEARRLSILEFLQKQFASDKR